MPDRDDRRQQIVASAIELLDEEGLDGLSMRRLAERTGASATSVYWYVKGKQELVALTLDTVIAEVELPDIDALGWRACAVAMARDFRRMVLRHPWLGLVAATYPNAFGPQLARHNEHVIAVYAAAGFDAETAMRAETAVYAFVLGSVLGRAGMRAWDPAAEVQDATAVPEAVRDYPRISARLDLVAAGDAGELDDAAFEFGLQAVLDGLAAHAT